MSKYMREELSIWLMLVVFGVLVAITGSKISKMGYVPNEGDADITMDEIQEMIADGSWPSHLDPETELARSRSLR